MARLKPYAAITGTFYGRDLKPLGDIVVDGKLINRGFEPHGIGFARDGTVRLIERRGSSRLIWTGCRAGIACWPRLLRDGAIEVAVGKDGLGPKAVSLKARRCAVGATRDGKLVMLAVTEPVTLRTLARAMLELGAVDAVNMDGGALCGFYADGRCRAQPLVPINNVLAVYKVQ
jgi:exopolysaccharide biosynthesis protein